jgi:hypothetical protein
MDFIFRHRIHEIGVQEIGGITTLLNAWSLAIVDGGAESRITGLEVRLVVAEANQEIVGLRVGR